MQFALLLLILFLFLATPTHAIVDPRTNPNNKVGINMLAPHSEIAKAKELVNTNGDWGYVVIVIKKSERDVARWQKVLNDLNRAHLIPIVRIATDEDSAGHWQLPEDRDAHDWADFLNKLQWPVKNKYVQVYNEVNRSTEWGGEVDPTNYAQQLSKTIDELKAKDEDFFILNAPLDLALATSNESLDALTYLETMEQAVPGIFQKLDGWASHSYPNPGFSASPAETHRRSITGYKWELSQITRQTKKELPVFITETGWVRNKLTEDQISEYYKTAFAGAWAGEDVAAVTPFVLSYKDQLFESFSFVKPNDEPYSYFSTIKDLPKTKGEPAREDKADIIFEDVPQVLIKGSPRRIYLTLLNKGNYIWNEIDDLKIEVSGQNIEAEIEKIEEQEILPNEKVELSLKLESKTEGPVVYDVKISNGKNLVLQKSYNAESLTYMSFVLSLFKSALP